MHRAVSTIAFLGMVVGLLGLVATHRLFSPSALVLANQAGAVALMIWARVTFGRRSFHFAADPTDGGLVTGGPYRYIRHPIYTAVSWFAAAGVAAHRSGVAVALGGLVFGGAVARAWCEETLLVARYPEYAGYAAKTWRMIPYVI